MDEFGDVLEDYTKDGMDGDSIVDQFVEEYGTEGEKTLANPSGIELTKFNGERATREFVQKAFKLDDEGANGWMKAYFQRAWDHYDAAKVGLIQKDMLPLYFKSLIGDFTQPF